jgi:hypothetical protein
MEALHHMGLRIARELEAKGAGRLIQINTSALNLS